MELWEALSNRRNEIGMSFDELQSQTKLSISTLKKILGGHVSNPSFESIRSIAYAMDITLSELDSRIAEDQPTISPEAQALAKIYDGLDAHSQRIVMTVAKMESERVADPVLPKGLTPMSAMPFHNIPNIGTLKCTGEIETKYAAKQEVLELQADLES